MINDHRKVKPRRLLLSFATVSMLFGVASVFSTSDLSKTPPKQYAGIIGIEQSIQRAADTTLQSNPEQFFFDRIYEKDRIESLGETYVDFVNAPNKPTMHLGGREVEYDYISWCLKTLDTNQLDEMNNIIESMEDDSSRQDLRRNLAATQLMIDQTDEGSDYQKLSHEFLELAVTVKESNSRVVVDSRAPAKPRSSTIYQRRKLKTIYTEWFDEDATYVGNFDVYGECIFGQRVSNNMTIVPTNIDPNDTLQNLNYVYYPDYDDKPFGIYAPTSTPLGSTNQYSVSKNGQNFQIPEIGRAYTWNPGAQNHWIWEWCGFYYLYPVHYTGTIEYRMPQGVTSYPHAETRSFEYKTHNFPWFYTLQNVTLILDYTGKEKMLVEYPQSDIKYPMTKEVHYARNQYAKNSQGIPYESLYPTIADLPLTWDFVPFGLGTYFHRLSAENSAHSTNEKRFLTHTYFDALLGVYIDGESELVYDSFFPSGQLVLDSHVKGTFNFGTNNSYQEGPINTISSIAHFPRDVTPYLIWGNDQSDYDLYTPFERFVWDKDASISGDGHTLSKTVLTSRYTNGLINTNGTEIPAFIQTGERCFVTDTHAPYFNQIGIQHLTTFATDIDWTTAITGLSDNVSNPGPDLAIHLYEIDNITYGRVGLYSVTVGAMDAAGNIFERTFSVFVMLPPGTALSANIYGYSNVYNNSVENHIISSDRRSIEIERYRVGFISGKYLTLSAKTRNVDHAYIKYSLPSLLIKRVSFDMALWSSTESLQMNSVITLQVQENGYWYTHYTFAYSSLGKDKDELLAYDFDFLSNPIQSFKISVQTNSVNNDNNRGRLVLDNVYIQW